MLLTEILAALNDIEGLDEVPVIFTPNKHLDVKKSSPSVTQSGHLVLSPLLPCTNQYDRLCY